MKNQNTYINSVEACLLLRISRSTLQKWRDNGTIPFYRIGGKFLYSPTELKKAMNKKKENL